MITGLLRVVLCVWQGMCEHVQWLSDVYCRGAAGLRNGWWICTAGKLRVCAMVVGCVLQGICGLVQWLADVYCRESQASLGLSGVYCIYSVPQSVG